MKKDADIFKLREELANLEHEQWSRWMLYMFSMGTFNGDGTWTMSAKEVDRLSRLVRIEYPQLPESAKESDRKEADIVLVLINQKIRKYEIVFNNPAGQKDKAIFRSLA